MQNRNTKTGPARGRLAVALAACAAFVSAPLFAASDLPGWDAELVKVVSSLDHTEQPCWFWAPETAKTNDVPLVVGLHTWSGDYKYKSHYAMVLDCAHKRGWAFLGPDFRGPNKTPKACGSDYAVQDIVDAVAYARRRVKVDASRIYIIGASGGGHMTLLMRARHPEIFAAAVAFCPVTDLARWHADSLADGPCRNKTYAEMLEASCGGTPADCKKEYLRRSPVAWLARPKSRQAKVPTYICTGIHDGWRGSVPVGHAIRAYNALAAAGDRVSEEDISFIEANQDVPPALAFKGKDPFFSGKLKIYMRRTSGAVRLTLFEGGHDGNYAAGFDFLSRQRKGRAPDWTLPASGEGSVEAVAK